MHTFTCSCMQECKRAIPQCAMHKALHTSHRSYASYVAYSLNEHRCRDSQLHLLLGVHVVHHIERHNNTHLLVAKVARRMCLWTNNCLQTKMHMCVCAMLMCAMFACAWHTSHTHANVVADRRACTCIIIAMQ